MAHFFALIKFNVYNRRNPDKAFIALRMLSYAANRLLAHYEQALVELLDFAKSSPEMVEWDEVDKIFTVWMYSKLRGFDMSDKTGRILADLFRGVFSPSCYPQI